jgi:soluble lytic murein transglycosylase
MIWLLLPSLSSAALPEPVVNAIRKGDCAQVLTLIGETPGLDAAVARARCGDADGLEDQLGQGGILEDYARLLLAKSKIDTAPAEAEALLAEVSLSGQAGLEARLLVARAQIAQGRSLDARDDLRRLLGTDAESEALYWLAWGAQTRGDVSAAVDAYESLWSKHVTSPFSAEAALRLHELKAPVPNFDTTSGRSLAMERARKLVKKGRADEAIPLYDGVQAVTGEQSASWRREMAMALFKAREYDRSMALMATLEPNNPGVVGGAETLYHFALGTSRTGDYEAAAVSYARLIELYPTTKRADTASFKLGYLKFDSGQLAACVPLFKEHLARYPSSAHQDEAWWFIGWSHYQLGELTEAEAAFDALLRKTPSSSLAPAARYWKARIRGQLGDPEGETAALEAVVSKHPTSGHAYFAAERLGRRFPGVGDVTIPQVPQSCLDSNPAALEAWTLAEAGQLDWARDRMQSATGAAKAGGSSVAIPVAHFLVEVGDYKGAQRLARPWCKSPWRASEAPEATMACYPRPEHGVVEEAAAAAGLPSLLPYAIMTAESALQPDVTSWAGARGLMQLMPSLGQELHAELQPDVAYDPDRLYSAGYNAWLGTTELGRLFTRFEAAGVDPVLPLLTAGYNGGADAVQRWLDGYEEPPPGDWFAENIGYTETRRYTRRVLGFLMAYRWIYGDD